MFKSFFQNIRNNKLAYSLNILGLAAAFVPFLIIMCQVKYDFSFDKFHSNSDKIFRLEREDDGWMSWISFPYGDDFVHSSPNIEYGAFIYPATRPSYITTENLQGKAAFLEDMVPATSDITNVFDFQMVEGVAQSFHEPGKALIPESMAKTVYGGEPAVGKHFTIDKKAWGCTVLDFDIAGVYKDFPANSQLRNAVYLNLNDRGSNVTNRYNCNFNVFVRLKELSDIESIERSFEETESKVDDRANRVRLKNISDIYFSNDYSNDPYAKKGNITTTITMLSIAILIILIAIINFTNFSMALVPFRIKGINTRKVLGSTDGELRRGLVGDAVLTTFLSYLIAVGLTAIISSTALRELTVADFTPSDNMPLVLLSALLALAIGVFAGLYPAKYTTSFEPALVLKGSFGLSPKGRALRKVLLGVQFVISIALVATAIFIQKQNRFMQESEIGMEKENIAVINISASSWEKLEAIEGRLKGLPEVVDIAYSDDKICSGDGYQNWGMGMGESTDDAFQTTVIPVSYNFFEVMGIPIIGGRAPLKSDKSDDAYLFIFNRYLMENENVWFGAANGIEVLGECENVSVFSMKKEMGNTAFVINQWARRPSCMGYVRLKKGTNPASAVENIRKAYAEIDPLIPLDVELFDTILENQYKNEQRFSSTINWFTILAVVISMMGIFGLIFFDTQQRKKEIAVRRILGASEEKVLWTFNRSYLIMLCICFVLSIPIVIYVTGLWLKNFAYRADLTAGIFALAFMIILLITVATINLQAVSAIRKNPVESIKAE